MASETWYYPFKGRLIRVSVFIIPPCEAWFWAFGVANVIDSENSSQIMRNLPATCARPWHKLAQERNLSSVPHNLHNLKKTSLFVNQQGLRQWIAQCNRPKAAHFMDWIDSKCNPEFREYTQTPGPSISPDPRLTDIVRSMAIRRGILIDRINNYVTPAVSTSSTKIPIKPFSMTSFSITKPNVDEATPTADVRDVSGTLGGSVSTATPVVPYTQTPGPSTSFDRTPTDIARPSVIQRVPVTQLANFVISAASGDSSAIPDVGEATPRDDGGSGTLGEFVSAETSVAATATRRLHKVCNVYARDKNVSISTFGYL